MKLWIVTQKTWDDLETHYYYLDKANAEFVVERGKYSDYYYEMDEIETED